MITLRIFPLSYDLSDEIPRLFDQAVQRIVGNADNAALMAVIDQKSGGFYVDHRSGTSRKRQTLILFDFFHFAVFTPSRNIAHRHFCERDDLCAACRTDRFANDGIYIDEARKFFCSFFQEYIDFLFFIHFIISSKIFFVNATTRTRPFITAVIRMHPFKQRS